MSSHPSILLLADSPGECELFRLALAQSGLDVALYTEQDPDAALHFVKVEARAEVKLILLDWHLRNECGGAFLKRVRADPRFSAMPVVIFTTSDDASDLASAYAHGANGYVVKPATFADLVHCVNDVCRYWVTRNRVVVMDMSRC